MVILGHLSLKHHFKGDLGKFKYLPELPPAVILLTSNKLLINRHASLVSSLFSHHRPKSGPSSVVVFFKHPLCADVLKDF